MKRIAVFVSGSGSNLQALIDACKNGVINGNIELVVSSKPGVYAIDRAKAAGIKSCVYQKRDYQKTEDMYGAVIRLLKQKNIDLIVLAGYLSILSGQIIDEYRNKIINIHPSLIPSFCGSGYYGLRVHKAVLDYGCKITGATVHFVDEGTDTGAIILQKAVDVLDGDTPEVLQKRVLSIEHKLLIKAVKFFCDDNIQVKDKKIILKGD